MVQSPESSTPFAKRKQRRVAEPQRGFRCCEAALPKIDGGTAGDHSIVGHRWETRQLRTQVFVAAVSPTGRRAGGASVPPPFSSGWIGGTFIQQDGERSGEACALQSAGWRAGATLTIVRDRSRCPVLRFPAVGRRPGPRRGTNFPCRLSAPLRLCVENEWVGGLVPLVSWWFSPVAVHTGMC